jgi:hypothetical protein
MDIDVDEYRRMFEEWAVQKNYPKEMWRSLWEAYWAGFCDAPGFYAYFSRFRVGPAET